MALEFAFSSNDNIKQVWVWFPNWSFKAEVFAELASQLPGQHYWYRWHNTDSFNEAVNEVCESLPNNAILIGWSLGGALAEGVAHQHTTPSALITFATPPKFCKASQWPYGMPQIRYEGFVSSYNLDPNKALTRFLSLNVQGISKPKALIRLLAHHQLSSSPELGKQLLWFNQYDFTSIKVTNCHCLQLFADHDALVVAPNTHNQGRYELINNTCHALFLINPVLIINKLKNIYTQLKPIPLL